MLFIDLVKAFDRVPRELLWDVLRKFGVPPKIVDLLIALHKSVIVKFEIDGVIASLLSIIGVSNRATSSVQSSSSSTLPQS